MNTLLLTLQSNCFANQQKLLIKQNKAQSDFHSVDDSSTLGDTDKFFKYGIGCTLLLIILFTFFLATFLFGVLAEFISTEQGDL